MKTSSFCYALLALLFAGCATNKIDFNDLQFAK